jgi:magnesium and cobalt transporter
MSDRPPSRAPRDDGAGTSISLLKSIRQWLKSVKRGCDGDTSPRQAVEEAIEDLDDSTVQVDTHERELLANMLDFGNTRVEDVMLPRPDIVAVEASGGIDDIVTLVREKGHSRLPIYRSSLDDVLGLIHIRDLLGQMGSGKPHKITELIRPILFVPPSMRVLDLLVKMRDSRIHMAVVADEYGGTDGLVTIEDIVEEIVGEIQDEHDEAEAPGLVEAADGTIVADARTRVGELEELLGLALVGAKGDIDEDDIDTIGGLVFTLIGRIPVKGELIAHSSGVEFEILDADPRRVNRLRVRRPATTEPA